MSALRVVKAAVSPTFGANSGLAAVAFLAGVLRVAPSLAFAVVAAGLVSSVVVYSSVITLRSGAKPT